MAPLEYCRQKAAPPGSALYYCVLFASPTERAALTALLALEQELTEVVESCSEASVALRKLEYWHGELAALERGEAVHPVTVALLSSGAGRVLTGEDCARLVHTAGLRIRTAQIRTVAELDAHCAGSVGRIMQVAGRLMGDAGRSELACEALGAACERSRLVALPRRAGMPPHTGVPLELLTRHAVRPADLDRGGRSPALASLRRALIEGALEALDRALEMPAPRALRSRARIARADLATLERSGYPETGEGRGITPLRKLWIAWRGGA